MKPTIEDCYKLLLEIDKRLKKIEEQYTINPEEYICSGPVPMWDYEWIQSDDFEY